MNDTTNLAYLPDPAAPPRAAEVPQVAPAASPLNSKAAVWNRVRNAAPTLLVLAALAALAIWGHHTGWAMPKFSALIGNGGEVPDDWCKEHGVPESVCIVCKPALFPKPKNYGWCEVHGIHDCPFEHPEIAQVEPQLDAEFLRAVARAEQVLKLRERPANGKGCKLHERLVQIASKEAFEKLGIGITRGGVWPERITEAITANGAALTYDQRRIARLSPRAAGTVWRVDKQVGDDVREGEVLALIDSAEVGRARAAYVHAIVRVDLKSKTLANLQAVEGAIQGRRLVETEAELREAQVDLLNARQALANFGLPLSAEELAETRPEKLAQLVKFLGLPEEVRRTLKRDTTTGTLLPITASLGCKVVAGQHRQYVAGEWVDTEKVLFTIADTSRMWLLLDIRVEETKLVQVGQKVGFRPDGHDKEIFGNVTWIDTSVDERTRTVKVRAEFSNPPKEDPKMRLQGHMWGTGRIVLREEKQALVVPNEAVHWEGCCWVVFVQDKDFDTEGTPKVFHVRKVRIGAKEKGNTEIIAGLFKGEMVATKNSGLLRSELLKNNLGAG